jgi:hypothetical protein
MRLYRHNVEAGAPSTADITQHVARLRFPAAIVSGPPVRFSDGVEPFALPREVPIVPLVYRALSRDFAQVDFELVLHAIEQLEPLATASLDRPAAADRYRPVLNSFVELARAYDLLNDPALLLAARACSGPIESGIPRGL